MRTPLGHITAGTQTGSDTTSVKLHGDIVVFLLGGRRKRIRDIAGVSNHGRHVET